MCLVLLPEEGIDVAEVVVVELWEAIARSHMVSVHGTKPRHRGARVP